MGVAEALGDQRNLKNWDVPCTTAIPIQAYEPPTLLGVHLVPQGLDEFHIE